MDFHKRWRDSIHMTRQARRVFGEGSKQHGVCQEIENYWWCLWMKDGGKIDDPLPKKLKAHIKIAKKIMKQHKRMNQ